MSRRPFSLPAPDTQQYRLLALTAISGEFPSTQISRLTNGESYVERMTRILRNDGLLHTYYKDKVWGYRLTPTAKSLLLSANPERYSFFLSGNTDTNRLKSEIKRRQRLHRIAQTYVTMQNGGVSIFRDEKPDLFSAPDSAIDIDSLDFSVPYFYSSREVKELGDLTIRIRGSRMTGLMTAPSGLYPIYCCGELLPEWDHQAEARVYGLLNHIFNSRRMSWLYQREQICALLLGNGMKPIAQLLENKVIPLHGQKSTYPRFYYLPHDHRGEVLLRLLVSKSMQEQLNAVLMQTLHPKPQYSPCECDAIDADGRYALFSYLPDAPRLQHFLEGMDALHEQGLLYCFDFQAEVLRPLCGKLAIIQSIDFDTYERNFL